MSYMRVIPRDLFNEASLLKCLGRVFILLDHLNLPGVELVYDSEGTKNAFVIEQDESSGAIFCSNVNLKIQAWQYRLERPLNSREAWPLYLTNGDQAVAVFDDAGNFTSEMLGILNPPSKPHST